MDSPVVLDKASEFGEPIDLDRPFPAFPFDDDGFGRRSEIRAHLDQLAARHPELADHLLGPAWGDIPFHGSLRTRNRRGSGNGLNNNYQGYSDEDARSQASGSSAASGASAVSSHGEPEGSQNHRERSRDRPDTEHQQPTGRTQIPQYGFRNTVDIGQHRHNMENPDKGNRGQRSMSAPPENRQQFCQQQPHQCHHNCQQQQPQSHPQPQSQPQPQQGQRYVSRIDITPQQPQQQQQPPPQQPQQPQQQKPSPQQQSNVRHIPIFVEGRDEPVLPRSFDEPHLRRESSPTQFHSPPHFQRSSPFGQSPFARPHQWSPQFQDSFYPGQSGYEQPSRRQQQTHGFQNPWYEKQAQPQQYEKQPQPQQYERQTQPQQYEKQPQPQQQRQRYAQQQHQHHPQQPPQQQQQQHQQQQETSPPRPKPVVPKDPLERVAMVQKEVDSLAEQVKRYSGNSRKDKEYMYLDEMLTRELIKLDDIETEGRENVRQARKNAIKTIQETIGLLESMAPLASQPATPQETENPIIPTAVDQPESMDVDRKQEEQTNEPIPLPPGPSSPLTKKSEETVENEKEETKETTVIDAEQPSNPPTDGGASIEPMDTTVVPVVEKPEEKPTEPTEPTPMDVQESSSERSNPEDKKTIPEPKEAEVATNVLEQNAEPDQKKMENDSSPVTSDVAPAEKLSGQESTTTVESDITASEQKTIEQQELAPKDEKMEVDGAVKQSPKTTKKGKKKKATTSSTSASVPPAVDTPIPLPPPESTETNAK